jgi:hypothetical protein
VEIVKYRRRLEIGDCRRRLESKGGGFKVKEEIGRCFGGDWKVEEEIGKYNRIFEWKGGGSNVQEETKKER